MTDGTRLILIGGGGHALVVAEAAGLAGLGLDGFLDDAADAPLSRGRPSCPRLGGFSDMGTFAHRPSILAIGDLTRRRSLLSAAREPVTVIHPRATISPSAQVGRGVYIGPGAVVHTRAVIGDHAIINSGSIVEHEVVVGENAHIAPGAVVGGRARIGADTLIGIRACVLPGINVGTRCLVGGGATVIGNITDGIRAAGVPARPL